MTNQANDVTPDQWADCARGRGIPEHDLRIPGRSPGDDGATVRDRVIGSCFACGGRLTQSQVVSIKDGQGIWRRLHRGVCADRFAVQNTPKIEGTPE